jgi:peptidoglycan/LPS O-acetylase OafA/YrhL
MQEHWQKVLDSRPQGQSLRAISLAERHSSIPSSSRSGSSRRRQVHGARCITSQPRVMVQKLQAGAVIGELHMINSPVREGRSSGLDIMRTVLAIWVILSHSIPWGLQVGGTEFVSPVIAQTMHSIDRLFQAPVGETHPAVLAFITVSGYCIHRNGSRTGSWKLIPYAIRRVFSIVVTFVGVLGFTLASWAKRPLAVAISGTEAISIPYLATKWWIGAKANDWRPVIATPLFVILIILWTLARVPLIYGWSYSPFLIEASKLLFALWIAAVIVHADRARMQSRLVDAFGRAGYNIYAFHAPIVYTALIFLAPWWLTISAAIGAGLTMFFMLERPIDRWDELSRGAPNVLPLCNFDS